MSTEKLYAERDPMAMDESGLFYWRHICAMTKEKLHSKTDIAAELGYRDMQITTLEARNAELLAALVQISEPSVVYFGYAAIQKIAADAIERNSK